MRVKQFNNWQKRGGSGIALGYGAIGSVPDASPFLLGGLGEGGNPYLTGRFKEADVVLIIGTSWWPDGYTPNDSCMIQVADQCAMLGDGIPIDYGIVVETAQIVALLVEGLKGFASNPDWME